MREADLLCSGQDVTLCLGVVGASSHTPHSMGQDGQSIGRVPGSYASVVLITYTIKYKLN